NTPGLTKLMGLTEHNSYQSCHYCDLKGIYIKPIYYPTTPPKNFNSTRYQVFNLLIRTYEEWKRRLKIIQKANSVKERNEFITSFGNIIYKLLLIEIK
ncbi:8890_t:CDS:1, partial [Gigaspora rosea]